MTYVGAANAGCQDLYDDISWSLDFRHTSFLVREVQIGA